MTYGKQVLKFLQAHAAFLAIASLVAVTLMTLYHFAGFWVASFCVLTLCLVAAGVYVYLHHRVVILLFLKRYSERMQQILGNWIRRDGLKRLYLWTGVIRWVEQAKGSKLPHFLVLGAAGSGKKSLLQLAGLHVTRKEVEACDAMDSLWFADQAVFVIPKADCFQAEGGRDVWFRLLAKLKSMKLTGSFQGIILTVDSRAVLHGPTGLEQLESVSLRINELYQYIGKRLPIYLTVTQCDALAGATAHYSLMDSVERQAALGVSLLGVNPMEEAAERLATCLDTATRRVIQHLSEFPEPGEKIQALNFLGSFNQLHRDVLRSVAVLCRSNRYQEGLCLRGVYFTSAIGAEVWGIDGLLTQVILALGKPIALTPRLQQRALLLRQAQVAVLIASFSGVFALFYNAYRSNSHLLQEGVMLARDYQAASQSHASQITKLHTLAKIGQHAYFLRHIKEQLPWYRRLGMARSQSQLDLLDAFFAKRLSDDLHKPVMQALVGQLAAFHQQWQHVSLLQRESLRGAYYSALKLELMLSFPAWIDLDFASHALAENWQTLMDESKTSRQIDVTLLQSLSRNYLDYLQRQAPLKRMNERSALSRSIELARRDLMSSTGVSNAYAELEHRLVKQMGLTNFEQLVEPPQLDPWRSDYELPRFFTKAGYVQVVQEAFSQSAKTNWRQDWVIHTPLRTLAKLKREESLEELDIAQQCHTRQELNQRYFSRYLSEWVNFIQSIRATDFYGIEEAAQLLRTLYQSGNTLEKLFVTISENVAIDSQLMSADYQALPDFLRKQFSELAGFVAVSAGKNDVLEKYGKQLASLQQDIERLSYGIDEPAVTEHYAVRLLNGQGQETELYKASMLVEQLGGQLQSMAVRQAVKSLLLSPIKATFRSMAWSVAKHLGGDWQAQVVKPYQEKLGHAFPFNHYGQDASLSEVSAFFSPDQGLFAQYFKRVAPFFKKQYGELRLKTWLGEGLPLSKAFRQTLKTIENFSRSLFPSGRDEIKLQYAIYPIPTPGVQEILFASNTQSYPYRNGPQEWVKFAWPAEDTIENETFLRITLSSNNKQLSKEFQGTWGLFHMLLSASQVNKMAQGYQLSWLFRQGGKSQKVRLLLATKTPADPFALLLFNPLTLPEAIS